MILEILTRRFRREAVPINESELETLDRDGPRALNYLMSRGNRRLRERALAVLRTLLFLAFAQYMFGWTGAGLLAFVVYGGVLTVLVDGMRFGLARRWLFYSHSRAWRASEVLAVGRSVESDSRLRPAPAAKPQQVLTLAISGSCTLIGLPLVWLALSRLGWASWDTVFANFFLPLCMLFIGVWRLARGFMGIQFAKGSTVGSRDLFLDSDDALDIYALALALAVLLVLPFGEAALAWVAYLTVLARLLAASYQWWHQRQGLVLLQRRVYRINPNAPATRSDWDHDESAADPLH